MKHTLSLILLFALTSASAGCYTDLDPGTIGLRVHRVGTHQGVEHHAYTGRVYDEVNVDVVVFPTTLQNVVWTRNPHEGSPNDESITFTVGNGIAVNADIGVNFRVDPQLAWNTYTRYHQTDLAALADTQIRNDVRDCIAVGAAALPIERFLGDGKAPLLAATVACVRERESQYGLVVENVAFVSAPRIPENVQAAINASLEAQQHLAQAEAQARAEVAAATGRANAEVAVAEGHSRAARIAAESDSATLLLRTRADAENRRLMAAAYRDLGAALTPAVLQYLALQRWNGVSPPRYGGSPVPTLSVTAP